MAGDSGLQRELNLVDALLINVGTTLASAGFIVHANVLAAVGHPNGFDGRGLGSLDDLRRIRVQRARVYYAMAIDRA